MTKITKRAVIISGILLAWFVGNSFFKKPEENKKITRGNKQTVRFRNVSLQSFDEAVNVRGYTKAWRSACLRARTSGEVEKIYVVSGQKVKENQLLVKLSDDSRFERLAKAKHDVKAKKLEYEALEKLGSMQYHSLAEVANKKTLYYAALLEEKQAKLDLEYSKIRAPFSGIVGSIYLNEGGVSIRCNIDSHHFDCRA
ncbi:MAG: hypothetical protein LBJ03_00815 [Holosporales bacterium]|jgi:multidrug efflux pump subunit AcrA (membrane-fusion protein)|nr:hypothetical protein [Holosporales bacterium]